MKNYDRFLKDFESLISINSVKAKAQENMPFGEGVFKAYKKFIEIANGLGFTVTDYDGYFGEITVGCGEELGVIGHLDVVPEGTGWNTPPFSLTKIDGTFYGRGVTDDKGPTLIAYTR